LSGNELLQHRLPALAPGDDGEALADCTRLQDRRLGHSDHRHLAHLFQRREPRIAEAGEHDRILAPGVVGQCIDRGVAGNGIANSRGDVARPERTGNGA
jgi:hypothetical protein